MSKANTIKRKPRSRQRQQRGKNRARRRIIPKENFPEKVSHNRLPECVKALFGIKGDAFHRYSAGFAQVVAIGITVKVLTEKHPYRYDGVFNIVFA